LQSGRVRHQQHGAVETQSAINDIHDQITATVYEGDLKLYNLGVVAREEKKK